MTRFFAILFFLSSFYSFGQKRLHGTFVEDWGMGGRHFIFYKNGSFEYGYSSCTSSIKGKGRYTLKKDKLLLNFTPDYDTLQVKSFGAKAIPCQLNDSIRLNFLVTDRDLSNPIEGLYPLPRIKIQLLGTGKDSLLSVTNEKGQAAFIVPKTASNLKIQIGHPGTWHQLDGLTAKACQDIRISLSFPFLVIPDGAVWDFTVKKAESKLLKLEKKDPETGNLESYTLRLRYDKKK